jgi:hypothetical protein
MTALSVVTAHPKGAILRHVLPFDEDTSSSDQARGRITAGTGTGTGTTTHGSSSSSSSRRGNGTVPAALQGHEAELEEMAEQAIALRRLIRVKMADEADFNQVGFHPWLLAWRGCYLNIMC